MYRLEGGVQRLESIGYEEGRIMVTGHNDWGMAEEFIDTWHVTDHLGNVRAVVDITDTGESVEDVMDLILEQNDYRPFGERVDDERMEVDGENRYRFAGKEEQTFLNGTYSDFGARFYSSDIQRWTTPDPLAEKYYDFSPYSFCANNPINFVDPDGEAIFHMNLSGEIICVDTTSTMHRLYFVDNDGSRTNIYIDLDNSSILEALAGKNGVASYTSSTNIDDFFKVFLFASDNSNVEWALHRGQDNSYTIGTKHDKGSAGTWEDYGIKKPIASVHSHPLRSKSFLKESESMGYYDDILLGDRANVVNDVDANGKQTRYNYVYFKNTGHLYHVEYYKPRFIKSVSKYRHFYFGTLNHK